MGGLSAVGGTPRKLLYLLKHSDPSRIRHSFICMEGGGMQREYERAGAIVHIVDSAAPIAIVVAALKCARRLRPRVIATHFTRSFVCGSLAARMLGLPVVHHEHGPALEEGPSYSPIALLGKTLRAAWLPAASLIVCNSRYTAQTVRQTYRVDETRLKVIHNPVEGRLTDGDCRRPPQDHAAKDALWIGHIGGMIPSRDQATLIRAIQLLRDRGVDARLILIGDGPQRASLERLSARLRLQPWVDFRGYQSDLSEFFRRVSIYVNPAIAEGFGIAVVEAMLESIAVVLANAGAHPELIEDNRTGLLYRAQDPHSLAARIAELAGDSQKRKALSAAGREHARCSFAPQRYARAYQVAIEAVLGGVSNNEAFAVTGAD